MESSEFTFEENFSFWKNLLLTAIFFVVTPLTIGVTLFSLFSLNQTKVFEPYRLSGAKVYAALPNTFPAITDSVASADARSEIIRQYLKNYNSKLEPFAALIVAAADKYGLDYRLITAIAQQESNLCKLIPPGSNNCWGWGIHSEGTLGFSSLEEGIEVVSKGLRKEYLDKGYNTIEKIMAKYAPLSNGSWARGVTQFMAEME